MTSQEHTAAAIDPASRLESLLRVLSLAADGAQISAMTFARAGGTPIFDLVADMAGEIVEILGITEKSSATGKLDFQAAS